MEIQVPSVAGRGSPAPAAGGAGGTSPYRPAAKAIQTPPFLNAGVVAQACWSVKFTLPYNYPLTLKAGVANFYHDSTGDHDNTTALTNIKIGFEPAAGDVDTPSGTVTPMLFAGSAAYSSLAGGAYVETDETPVVFGGFTNYWLRIQFGAGAGGYPGIWGRANAGDNTTYHSGRKEYVTTSDVAHGGSMGTTIASGFYPAPVHIIGRYAEPTAEPFSIAIIGDSRALGGHDPAVSADENTYLGFMRRYCIDYERPYIMLARGGARIDHQYGTAFARRQVLMRGYDVAAAMVGYNNYNTGVGGGSEGLATFGPKYYSMWSALRAGGARYIIQCNEGPAAGSTSGDWISAADQTAVYTTQIAGANAIFTAELANHTIDAVAAVNEDFADPLAPTKWNSDGNPDTYTDDGVHYSATASVAAENNTFAAAIDSLYG